MATICILVGAMVIILEWCVSKTHISITQSILLHLFSKHRPSGPMLSISRNIRLSVSPSVCVSVCSLLRYRLNVFLPPLPKVKCPIFLEIRNPWEKVMERSGLIFEHFCLKIVKNCRTIFFFADFALQNMVETTIPDGLETSGWRVYR